MEKDPPINTKKGLEFMLAPGNQTINRKKKNQN
jgi:hypothetical protein